ncbi:MAG: hypothetical protein DRJ37_06155 [Thermoprotei archaeon]|nr:MAG: hypothetical protein DRJ37_06155 [Thermoprotei archaeon]
MKKPWIGLLFTLHYCEAVRPSRLLKANGIHKMEYIEGLISKGLAVTFITFRSSGRTRVIRYVRISDKGRAIVKELMGLVKKHGLENYVKYKIVNGLYVLEEDSRDLLYVLAKINRTFDRIDKQLEKKYAIKALKNV